MTSMIIMWDDINTGLLPPNAAAYAGYVDGNWANFGSLQQMFPHAKLLSIAVFPNDDADCLDVETGDATIADIYGWFKRQQAKGTWKPCVYSSVGNMDHIYATMTANGFARDSYRLWSAHYGAGQHICGPVSCRQTSVQCDGTQFTSTALGKSLDESELDGGFFYVATPTKTWQEWTTGGMESLETFATSAGMPVSTFLRVQVDHYGAFNSLLSQYIQNGDLKNTHMPAGMKLWTLA